MASHGKTKAPFNAYCVYLVLLAVTSSSFSLFRHICLKTSELLLWQSTNRVNPLTTKIFNNNNNNINAIDNFKWVKKFRFDKMKVDDFEIFLIDVTFYP